MLAPLCLTLGCGDPTPLPETNSETGSTGGPETSSEGPTSAADSTGADPATTDSSGGETSMDTTTGGFPPPVLDECIDDGTAGDHVYTCGRFTYDVSIPEACLQMPCGLIMDVHGYTMSGQMQEANTSLRALGVERGYIVVQPNANPPPPSSSWTPWVDDEAVVDFMLRVSEAFHVDPDRLHFTGFSQGGYMTWRVICQYADLLASAAPAAACGGGTVSDCDFDDVLSPDVPVDILYLHGTDDVLVPYDCAPPRRDAVVAAFDLGEEESVSEGDGLRWVRHTGEDGTVLEMITHEYNAQNTFVLGGHCYPGSDDPGDAPGQLFSYACIDPTDLHWGTAVIDFFDTHRRGG